MSAIDRGIGSHGLEQGGPNLGNDYTRPVGTTREAGDTVIYPKKEKQPGEEENESLNMDRESSRNLSSGSSGLSDDVEGDENEALDLEDDDELDDIEIDEDDDEDDEENDII
jgi:hypothetical protein